jgi:pilus assembly protein CpaE
MGRTSPGTLHGRVMAVYGPKSGVGCTTIAVNLAVALHQRYGAEVALVDGALPYADLGVFLGIDDRRSLADLVAADACADPAAVQGALVRHRTGVSVLLAPPLPEQAESVTPRHVAELLATLRDMFRYVVVDTWSTYHEVMLSILDAAHVLIVVGTPEPHIVRNMQSLLRVATLLRYLPEKLTPVLNRSDSGGGVPASQAEHMLGCRFAAGVANDWRLARLALDTATPFVLSHPASQIARDVCALADLLAGPDVQRAGARRAQSPGLLAGLASRWRSGRTAAPPGPQQGR